MNRLVRIFMTLGALGSQFACDESPPPPTSLPAESSVVDPVEKHLTSVPVNEQPRKTLVLKLIPFTLRAPESWEVVSIKGGESPVTMIEGPILDDQVRITLGLREPVGGEVLKNLLKRFEKEDADLKKNGQGFVRITDTGDLRVIDLRRKPLNSSAAPSEQLMEWRITLLYPRGVVHEQYTLQFIGLTVEAYEKNKDLLSEILQSIRYDEYEMTPLPTGF